jgi:NADH-quinone oxidoreductase subunit C
VIRLSSADTEAAPDTEEVQVDEARDGIVEGFRRELGDGLVDSLVRPGDDMWVRIATGAWRQAAEVARNRLRFDYFCFLSALDWLPSPWGRYEDAAVDTPTRQADPAVELARGVTGGETRMQVLARLTSTRDHVSVTLKADVPDDDPSIESWVSVYAGADWHERETWEMFGITFVGHPHLHHIYLPGDFEGHPLRKDYPLLSRIVKPWPGIVDVEPMPGEPAEDEEPPDAEADG